MFPLRPFALLFCALAMPAPGGRVQAPHPRPARTETIWKGVSGSFRWTWTTAEFTARSAGTGRSVFSASTFEKRSNPTLKETTEEPWEGYLECAIHPLSVAGSIASYERDYYWEGGAHPSGSIDFVSVDVTNPGRRLFLTDLFPDAAILEALLADKIVSDTLKRNHVAGTPKSTAQLVKLLNGKSFGGDDNGQFAFTPDFLARFAFHHVQGDRVAVRLNVSWNYEVYRFTSTQIGVLLPMPARLRGALARAAASQEGFLMPEAERRAGNRTTLLFTMGKQPK